jgi:hypothetical protein
MRLTPSDQTGCAVIESLYIEKVLADQKGARAADLVPPQVATVAQFTMVDREVGPVFVAL